MCLIPFSSILNQWRITVKESYILEAHTKTQLGENNTYMNQVTERMNSLHQ